jgi:hydroxyacylglutathione hydrolase
MLEIVTIETPDLGDRSYLVHDGQMALVIDPQRDIDRFVEKASSLGVHIAAVAETHIHNDYVTGGYQLAQLTGADYLVSAADPVSFERHPVADGDEIKVGSFVVQALSTPGHTPHHMSYAVSKDGHVHGVFTGGSLLYGTVGRTDLIGADQTDYLTRAQFHSARKLIQELPPETPVFPTHGFGSFCSSAQTSGVPRSTLAMEQKMNIALRIPNEDEFVKTLLAGLTAYPSYYVHMAPMNLAGPPPVDLGMPEPVSAPELAERLRRGEWVVDLRQRRAFALNHISGTIGVEFGSLFTTYLGWIIPWDTPLTLLGESPEQVLSARRALVRIGIDKLAGAAVGAPEDFPEAGPLSSYRVTNFRGLEQEGGTANHTVVDVRLDDEWDAGHLEGAIHIPLHHLPEKIDQVPPGEVWVHCGIGYRSSIAASLLHRAGHEVVLVDDSWDAARRTGMPIVEPPGLWQT